MLPLLELYIRGRGPQAGLLLLHIIPWLHSGLVYIPIQSCLHINVEHILWLGIWNTWCDVDGCWQGHRTGSARQMLVMSMSEEEMCHQGRGGDCNTSGRERMLVDEDDHGHGSEDPGDDEWPWCRNGKFGCWGTHIEDKRKKWGANSLLFTLSVSFGMVHFVPYRKRPKV